jgi:HlyD family secretion protein
MNATLTKVRYVPLLFLGIFPLAVGVASYATLTARAPRAVPVQTPPQVETVSALGRLEPEGEVIQVFAPTSLEGARIERLNVVHGQQIRMGDVIAWLDTYARRAAALREAQAQVAVAYARLQQVEAGAKVGQIQAQQQVINRLQAELQTESAAQIATIQRLEAEHANAQLESQRYKSLYGEGAISASLLDSKQLTAAIVEQQLQEARAELNRILLSRQTQIAEAQATLDQIAEVRPVDVQLARSQVTQAEAGVDRAQADLDLAVVRSPQEGQVLKIHTRPGELVGSDGILSLGQTTRMVAVAEVYELDLSHVRIGQSAQVISKNNSFADVLQGEVVEVGLEIGKLDVLNTDPAAQFDARVVEVKVLLDDLSSRKVSGLTNLTVQVSIDVRAGAS